MNFNSVIRPIACAIAISCALNATVEAQKDISESRGAGKCYLCREKD